jgi:hypothetical protein
MEHIGPDEMVIEYVGDVVRPLLSDIREKRYEKQVRYLLSAVFYLPVPNQLEIWRIVSKVFVKYLIGIISFSDVVYFEYQGSIYTPPQKKKKIIVSLLPPICQNLLLTHPFWLYFCLICIYFTL